MILYYLQAFFMIFLQKSMTSRFPAVISAYYAELNNYYFFEGRGRQTAFMQLIFSLSREILTLCYKVEVQKQKLVPHFFCPNFGQKNMKPEKASLHAPKVRFMAHSAASYAVRRAS